MIASSSSDVTGGVKAVNHASLLEMLRQQALWSTGGLAEIPALEGSLRPISVNKECMWIFNFFIVSVLLIL